MKATTTIFGLVAIVLLGVSTSPAHAAMGQVWPTAVTPNSITIDWTDPDGIHGLATPTPLYRVCWEVVDLYHNAHPAPSLSCPLLLGADAKPYVITGLEAGKYYRIRVEAFSQKKSSGEWVNPAFREVGSVKQKTPDPADPRLLQVTLTEPNSISVRFSAPVIEGIQVIRVGYIQSGRSQEFSANLRKPQVPSWRESDAVKGWVDVLANYPVEVTFPGLLSGQSYEIQVYGHKIYTADGVRLGRASAKTGGHRALTTREACLSVHFPKILAGYGARLREEHGMSVFDTVAELFPELNDLRPQLEEDEAEDFSNDLTALLYLIEAQHAMFEYWQLREEENGVTLLKHLTQVEPDLAVGMAKEIDPSPAVFRRGDATSDSVVDISDPIRILGHLFLGNVELRCSDAADANDSERVDMSDAIYLLAYLFFSSSPPPAAPFPGLGVDTTGYDAIGCEEYHED